MCNASCVRFVKLNLDRDEVSGRRVLEVGSRDVNGSVRDVISALQPESYVGTDIMEGEGVDIVCNAEDLVTQFHGERFDIVISTGDAGTRTRVEEGNI